MPVATVSDRTERKELRSLEGGYVVLRRMSYGQKMTRRSFTSKASVHAKRGQKDMTAEMELIKREVQLYEFAHCIVEHNLTFLLNPNDLTTEAPLDFRKPEHVDMLDGKVGEEIETYIGEMNNFEDDMEGEESGN